MDRKKKNQPDIDITTSSDGGKRNGLDLIRRQDAIDIVEFECGEWTAGSCW